MLWLSHAITVQLLELHTKPPLDACTYVGIDSGAPHLRMVSVSVIVVPQLASLAFCLRDARGRSSQDAQGPMGGGCGAAVRPGPSR